MLWSIDGLFETWCDNETNVRNEEQKNGNLIKFSVCIKTNETSWIMLQEYENAKYTQKCVFVTFQQLWESSLSGYQLNNDALHLVTHANTSHSTNQKKLFNQRQNGTLLKSTHPPHTVDRHLAHPRYDSSAHRSHWLMLEIWWREMHLNIQIIGSCVELPEY